MAFSLASPLAKFLNGLEIVLCKAQVSSASKTPHVPCNIRTLYRVAGNVDRLNNLEKNLRQF